MSGSAVVGVSAVAGVSGDGLAEFMKSLKVLPKLVVMDVGESHSYLGVPCQLLLVYHCSVDYTLWPFHVDCSVYQPFRSDG